MRAHDPDGPELVGAVARRLGVSVRTLHHWDALGVASPSGRTAGGYRAYSPADIAYLRRVMLFRELGIELAAIPALLDTSGQSRRHELAEVRRKLGDKITDLQRLAGDLDRLLDAHEGGLPLTEQEQSEIFGATWDPSWTQQARDRWDGSAQWAEYVERSSQRTSDEWRSMASATDALHADLAGAMRSHVEPGTAEANALAERHRAAQSEHFHCTHSMHVLIARRYVTEAGFTAFYDDIEPGLAEWLTRIIDANATAKGVDPSSAQWI